MFADYFIEEISKIRDELHSYPEYSPEHRDTDQLVQFHPVSAEYISKEKRQMASKSCKLDPIPTTLLKRLLPWIIHIITDIINESITKGVFPMEWKTAIIRLLLKKLGLTLVHSNYRPLSNLPFLSKVVEKVVHDQFRKYCDNHRMIPHYQSAYLANYSCKTALLKIIKDILWAMERQDITTLIAIDLSAAFDTVNHNILKEVLHRRFGVTETALEWFASYLKPRFCRVNVNRFYSLDKQLECSIPQGSIAGPMLYTVYASMIESVLEAGNQTEDTLLSSQKKKPDLHGFFNDHAVRCTFKASDRQAEGQAVSNIGLNASNIKGWMDCNRLKMNDGITEFIMFRSKIQLAKCITNSININGTEVQKSEVTKYLGAWLDQNLTLTEHVNRKCQNALINLLKIKQFRRVLTQEAAHILVRGLVISHLDYCNSMFAGLPTCRITLLQQVQNTAAKLVVGWSKYASATDALKHLHWLPICLRVEYKILVQVYKCLTGAAPLYLQNLLTPLSMGRRGLRSEHQSNWLVVPFTNKQTFAKCFFSVNGPLLWNALPNELGTVNDIEHFKSRLKTHLFGKF